MEILWEVVVFALKGAVVVSAVTIIALVLFGLSRRNRGSTPQLEIRPLNRVLRDLSDAVRSSLESPSEFRKRKKRSQKAEKKKEDKPRVFVLDFHGDLAANAVQDLRNEISALLPVVEPRDEVVVRLESAGGVVHGYGLAASQLARLKARKSRLVVCVDRIAASGGYMMACVADEVVAAPFAVLGSIGVVAPVPNIHRLLSRSGVDYEEMTAGEFKRTVSFLGEISEAGRTKFQEQLEETHGLFKDFVQEHRPAVDIDRVSTGEYWLATRAKELGLVNRLMTSDDYLMEKLDHAQILEVSYSRPKSLRERVGQSIENTTQGLWTKLWTDLLKLRWGTW